MKLKILLMLFISFIVTLSVSLTYSAFNTNATANVDQKIAKFVFKANKLDHLELKVDDLTPGDSQDYLFSVTNNENFKSDVVLNYQIIIRTFHFMPLTIELYKVEGENEGIVMNCDETYSRNTKNELVCNSAIQEMSKDLDITNDYKLKVTFPKEYNTEEYANLVDFIDVEIKSWQKTEGD